MPASSACSKPAVFRQVCEFAPSHLAPTSTRVTDERTCNLSCWFRPAQSAWIMEEDRLLLPSCWPPESATALFGSRTGHGSVCDWRTSGNWGGIHCKNNRQIHRVRPCLEVIFRGILLRVNLMPCRMQFWQPHSPRQHGHLRRHSLRGSLPRSGLTQVWLSINWTNKWFTERGCPS
jgi:hypothetical protein